VTLKETGKPPYYRRQSRAHTESSFVSGYTISEREIAAHRFVAGDPEIEQIFWYEKNTEPITYHLLCSANNPQDAINKLKWLREVISNNPKFGSPNCCFVFKVSRSDRKLTFEEAMKVIGAHQDPKDHTTWSYCNELIKIPK